MELTDVQIGSIITVKPNFGKDPAIRAVVTDIDVELHNNQHTIGYKRQHSNSEYWAYLDQIVKVNRY